jgi:hypothetical protein
MDDGEDDPVPEAVDELAGACGHGDAGDHHFFIGDSVPPEVVHEVGPARGCLTGLESGVVGDVLDRTDRPDSAAPTRTESRGGSRRGLAGLTSTMRPGVAGHSRQAIARVNMRSTSASVC